MALKQLDQRLQKSKTTSRVNFSTPLPGLEESHEYCRNLGLTSWQPGCFFVGGNIGERNREIIRKNIHPGGDELIAFIEATIAWREIDKNLDVDAEIAKGNTNYEVVVRWAAKNESFVVNAGPKRDTWNAGRRLHELFNCRFEYKALQQVPIFKTLTPRAVSKPANHKWEWFCHLSNERTLDVPVTDLYNVIFK